MKKYSVKITKKAEKMIDKLDKQTALRIRNFINGKLEGCENPRFDGIPLVGNLHGNWRYRIGDYRIIAQIEDDKILITIVKVDHRRQTYSR